MKKDQSHHSTSLFDQSKDTKNTRCKKSEAVKLLELLADEAARKRYPNTPPHYLAPRKYDDKTANGLTKCIVDFIRLNEGQAERINSTGRRIDTQTTFCDVVGCKRTIGSTKWINSTGTNGTADISATIAGLSVKIEVKIGKDRQSEVQKLYQQAIEKAGGIYIIASSFEQFLTWYKFKFQKP